jgi:hypothetical protein
VQKERRVYARIEVAWPVTIDTAEGIIHGEIKNISLGGALIRCGELPITDEAMEMNIELPHYAFPVSATAEKARQSRVGHKTTASSYGLAVCFTKISDEDLRLLCNAVEGESHRRNRHPRAKKAISASGKTALVESLEKLGKDLKRPFKDLLEEAMQDLLDKYEREFYNK